MSYAIYSRPLADQDALEHFFHYDAISPELGERFKQELEHCVQQIATNPFLFQVRYRIIRIAYLRKFHYGVHYVVEGKDVFIIAVLSTKDDPTKWDARL